MPSEHSHLSDGEALRWVDGEIAPERLAGVRRRLNACEGCRTKVADLEQALSDLVHLYGQERDRDVPPGDAPRTRMQARLAARAASRARLSAPPIWQTAAGLAVMILVLIALSNRSHAPDISAVPNLVLTPGATSPITRQEVCGAALSRNDPAVPDPLKQEVLRAYGLNDTPREAYQIDYLVSPQLGGAASIRNLWPEPALKTVWSAGVKDQLEDRLRSMVCSGQLDLTTAQRDLSRDWVAAYKKYFGTQRPRAIS